MHRITFQIYRILFRYVGNLFRYAGILFRHKENLSDEKEVFSSEEEKISFFADFSSFSGLSYIFITGQRLILMLQSECLIRSNIFVKS